jgi:hypothetical protein
LNSFSGSILERRVLGISRLSLTQIEASAELDFS